MVKIIISSFPLHAGFGCFTVATMGPCAWICAENSVNNIEIFFVIAEQGL